MRDLIEALKLMKEIEKYDTCILIALGVNKIPMSLKEGFELLKLEDARKEL